MFSKAIILTSGANQKMNKIISMSVWGDNPRYIVGARRQIELAEKHYPDWSIRLYVDNKFKFHDLFEAVDIREVKDGSYGMFWRFMPLFESDDNIVMVRDSDSRITIREQRCIEEWLQSDQKFHTFRDHDAHYEFPIIGCAFAMKGKLSEELLNIMSAYMHSHKYYLSDQFYLRDYVYPAIKDSMFVHSMRDDGWFAETRKKLINPFSFCGNGYDENDMPLYPNSLENVSSWNPEFCSKQFKFDGGILNE